MKYMAHMVRGYSLKVKLKYMVKRFSDYLENLDSEGLGLSDRMEAEEEVKEEQLDKMGD